MRGVAAQRIVHPIRKPRNNADEAIAPKPGGTGLSGRSALSRRLPVGPATGIASLRASHPGKLPSRPRGAHSEVPRIATILARACALWPICVAAALAVAACAAPAPLSGPRPAPTTVLPPAPRPPPLPSPAPPSATAPLPAPAPLPPPTTIAPTPEPLPPPGAAPVP